MTDQPQPTIFVVDDDAAMRKALALSLSERGFEVECFESAEQFLNEFDSERLGCLLLDVRMPHSSGLELQDTLRGRGVEIPIIFLTAHGDIPTTVRAMRKGAIDFLEKPYQLEVLLKRIEEALAKDQQIHQSRATDQDIRARYERLSAREREVMVLLVAGAANTSNREIAERLGISRRTVDTYRARLMEKMHARSLPDLVTMAKVCGVYEA